MTRLWKDWMTFWFKPQTASVLGLYRIVIGLLTLYSFALFAKDAAVFFSDEGVLRTATLSRAMGRDYHTILQWIPSATGVRLALGALFLAAFSFTVGFQTRLSSIVLYVLVVSFHERNNLVLNGGDTVLRTMLFFFMFAPSGAAFSVDRLRRLLREPEGCGNQPALIHPWAQRMMQVQVTIIYLVTAYAKSRGALYHDGTAMYYVFGLVDFNVHGVEQLMNYPLAYSALTYLVLFIETALPFLLWFRASRPYAMGMGLLAHGWIMVMMTIPVFGILMFATYLPFVSEEELEKGLGRIRGPGRRQRARVYVDGACAWGLKARRLLGALDLFGRVEALDARTVPEESLPPGVDRRALLEEWILVTPRGRTLRGFDAWRWVGARLPATCWLAPALYLPGAAFVARRLYRRMARRGAIPPGSLPSPEALGVGSAHTPMTRSDVSGGP